MGTPKIRFSLFSRPRAGWQTHPVDAQSAESDDHTHTLLVILTLPNQTYWPCMHILQWKPTNGLVLNTSCRSTVKRGVAETLEYTLKHIGRISSWRKYTPSGSLYYANCRCTNLACTAHTRYRCRGVGIEACFLKKHIYYRINFILNFV